MTRICATSVLALFMATPLMAKTTYYCGNYSGWEDPRNYWTNGIPYAGDTAIVDNNSHVYADTHCHAMELILGDTAGNRGSCSVHPAFIGGSLTTHYTACGYSGNGSFWHYGSTHTVSEQLVLGYQSTGEGTYSLQDGTLDAYSTIVGAHGTGTFWHSGGTHDVETEFGIAYGSGSTGRYELSGGSVSSDVCYIGISGQGILYQTNGDFTVNGTLRLGDRTGSSGTIELYDGTIYAKAQQIGRSGKGHFSQSGGTNTTPSLWLSSASGSPGTYTMSGGRLSAAVIYVGATTSQGRLEITDNACAVEVLDRLVFAEASAVQIAEGVVINMKGSTFENKNTDPTDLLDLANLTLVYEGGTDGFDPFEVSGIDVGGLEEGFDTNFALGTLQIGSEIAPGQVQLVDLFDNSPTWQGTEALYVETLMIDAGSSLDLNGIDLYCQVLANGGGSIIENGGSITVVPEPCTISILSLGAFILHRRRRI